ncbi:MAG: hypothetical protein JWN18_71 [Parcubacteria group bacterium]|nr:hypothetical protein [Parcubacteria group bacterium]
MNTDQTTARQGNISWITIVLGVITIVTFFAVPGSAGRYIVPMMTGGGMSFGSNAGVTGSAPKTGMAVTEVQDMRSGAPSPTYYPNYNNEVPSTDTREFLKTNYSAMMRTRDVVGLTRRVETTVRGHAGRVDQESSAKEYGYVSFSIPQSKYDDFRTEVESMVGSRFLTVNISSQNLLPQKVSIEEQKADADKRLANFKSTRKSAVGEHTFAVQLLQTKINADQKQLDSLRTQPSTPEIAVQTSALLNDQFSLKQQLANENKSYAAELSQMDVDIALIENWQKTIQTQDQTLLDNVATVTGTISVQWISLWDMLLLYLPGYSVPAIFAVLTVLSFLRDRRRTTTNAL